MIAMVFVSLLVSCAASDPRQINLKMVPAGGSIDSRRVVQSVSSTVLSKIFIDILHRGRNQGSIECIRHF